MTTYDQIRDYLLRSAGNRANILPSERGLWVLIGGCGISSDFSAALKTMISDQVPDGTQVESMWLWLRAGKMRFSYRTIRGDLRTLLLIPSHFEDFA